MPVRAFVVAVGGAALVLGSYWLATHIGTSWRGVFVVEHVVIHVVLAVVFGSTLAAGKEPLVTVLARRVHLGVLTEAMTAYSRKVTAAWTVYFVAMGALSVAVFAFAPFDAWSAFAYFGTPAALVAMFVGEHLLRYRLHPEFERASLGAALSAYSSRRASRD